MSAPAPRIRLVTRGDDAGSSESANRAVVEACKHGLLRNVSVMVPGPAFAAAARALAELPDVCLGFHVTLNSEWHHPKWGPVLPPEQVPSLVDEQGYFYPSPHESQVRGARLSEVMAEVQAQLNHAREHGLRFTYLDEHMGVGQLPDLREALAALAQREGLIYARGIPPLPPASHGSAEDAVEELIRRLRVATPGTYLLVTHPTFNDEEMRAVWNETHPPGVVARQRDDDRRMLSDARVAEACRVKGVEVARYDDVLFPPVQGY